MISWLNIALIYGKIIVRVGDSMCKNGYGPDYTDTLPETPSGTRVKIMLWDDFDNLEPAMEFVIE